MKTILLTLLAVLTSASLAGAQYAPAGNSHPESEQVTHSGETIPSPFGERALRPTHSIQDKYEFMNSIDLEPMRSLAVLHNGRVKVMGTLARETVVTLTGKNRYHDTVLIASGEGDADPVKLRQDPMFTLMDVIIDPGHYLDKPIIGVDYLPLRRAMVEAAFPGDELAQERFLVKGRVTPIMADSMASAFRERFASSEPHLRALNRVDRSLVLFQNALNNLLLIAPESEADTWHHLAEWPETSPVQIAAKELGDAWRALDAERTNAAIIELSTILPTINADLYPTTRRSLELAYNDANAFEWGTWLYGLAFVLLLLSFGTGRGWLKIAGVTTLSVAVVLHATGFTLRCIIAERFAIQNQFESMTGLSLFTAIVGLGLLLTKKQWLFAAATAGVGFLVLIAATQTAIPGQFIEREAAILNTSVLLKYHVTTVLASYGLISLGFIISLFYLGTHYSAKVRGLLGADQKAAKAAKDQASSVPSHAMGAASAAELSSAALGSGDKPRTIFRVLGDLDKAQMTVLQLAFWTLGVGVLLGAWWADHSWGRWWAFDPKETWALVTWIIYLIVIHVRFGAKDKGLTTAWLSVLGFIVMLWTYFGVNLLLPGLHAYA